ncbi:hypothetical protein ACVIDN_006073 [Rhizobium brockwellii]
MRSVIDGVVRSALMGLEARAGQRPNWNERQISLG